MSYPSDPCDAFVGRLAAICRCEATTLEKCNAFRRQHGIPPRDAMSTPKPIEPVGTIFKSLIDGLGIDSAEGCNCEALRIEMDLLGVDGCKQQRARLISSLRKNAEKVSWLAKVKAIPPALASGLAFRVDPFDPIPGLFDEAVRRAEEKSTHAESIQ